MVRRSSPSTNVPRGRRLGRELGLAALLASALPGCPLTDEYFVDPLASFAGSATAHGGAGPLGGRGGDAAAGVSGAVAGTPLSGSGGTDEVGGTGGTGGDATLGGGVAGLGGSGGSGGSDVGGDSGAPAAGEGGAGGEPPCGATTEICDGKDNDCNDEVDEEAVCPDHCTGGTFDGHLYVLCMWAGAANFVTYDAASARCEELGTELELGVNLELAAIESAEENTFLRDWIVLAAPRTDDAVWMGANDIDAENTWVWGRSQNAEQFFSGNESGGGTPYMGRFNDFGEGRPNSANGTDEDCGAIDAEVSWQWNDRACSSETMGFVCEQYEGNDWSNGGRGSGGRGGRGM